MREAYASRPEDQPRNMAVSDGVATIAIDGVLTEEPDCFALLFGGGNTAYTAIRKGLAMAEADPSVKRIQLLIDSPGGEVRGLFETFAALDAVTKPISVRASLAASAAYGLAAVAGPIEAATPASEFGSIGVAVRYYNEEDAVDIASTEAPKKRPDMTTDEGKAVVREELDALHDLFASAIAKGRSASTGDDITTAMVNAEFGRGGVLLAGAAKRAGMIDKIAKQPMRTRAGKRAEDFAAPVASEATNPSASDGGSEPREPAPPAEPQPQARTKDMNKAELQAQHPELYASIVAEGEAKERKRVNAHLKLAKSHNAMDIATAAIASGASVTDEEVFADYLSAGKNKDAQAARQADSDAAGAALNNASAPKGGEGSGNTSASTETLDEGDLVARALNLPLPKAGK